MPLGSGNPIPMQVGGSPTRFEKAYTALQRMVGRNGYSTDDDEIEALWRQAKADAMAALESFDERAALQASPALATDHIPLFEEQLGIETDTSLSDEQRRQIIVPDYTGVPEAWTQGLTEAIERIEPNAGILHRPWVNAGATQIGRWYEPFAPTANDDFDSGGDRRGTSYPNVSDMHSVIVNYPLGSGVAPTREQLRRTEQIRETLNDVCPAWVDHHVVYSIGFTLDLSLLDATAFGS